VPAPVQDHREHHTNYSWDVEGSLALLLSDGTNNYIYGWEAHR